MFASKPSKIRQRTVIVPVKKPTSTPESTARTSAQITTNGASSKTRTSASSASTPAAPGSRFQLTPSNRAHTQSSAHSRPTERKSLTISHQRKRKVTPSTPQWASSDESSDDDNDGLLGSGGRKRQKTSSSIEPMGLNRCLEPDPKRRIRFQIAVEGDVVIEASDKKASKRARLIAGLDMSRGDYAKDFKSAFPGLDKNLVVELQYPSRSRPERFEAVVPKNLTDWNPLDDIYFSIDEIIQHYLPSELTSTLSSEVDGPVRLLKRAVAKNAPSDFTSALNSFNTLISSKLSDKTIPNVVDAMHAIPLSLTKCILAQVYQRTVSPRAHLLRRVKGKETTYGELLPSFVHTIFHQTQLSSSSVFIDLGSGVGNVVLQSALQTGAESHGIEIMETPARFAQHQASELRARARLWNLSLGPMSLYQGDFLESAEVDAVLKRADVVLVNNKVFHQELNEQLLIKFLDLKEGCRVVSLESFGGGGKGKGGGVRNEQSIAGLFEEESFRSGTDAVSWAGEGVEYFIARKVR